MWEVDDITAPTAARLKEPCQQQAAQAAQAAKKLKWSEASGDEHTSVCVELAKFQIVPAAVLQADSQLAAVGAAFAYDWS